MAFFNRFPYTNFHELNLDWILEKINEVIGTSLVKTVNNKSADATGNIEIEASDIPNSVLTVNNISPDSNGNLYVGTVRTVNNNAPDGSGNVDAGTVKSVNSETPDSDGNVLLVAADIAGAVRRVNGLTPDAVQGNVNVGTVKSVNNTSPDADGNVSLPTVAGVTSVNNQVPDGSGNVTLAASDVGAVPTGNLKFKIYNSVSDVGLTPGSATVTGAFMALSSGDILIAPYSDFIASSLPSVSSVGFVEIFKGTATLVGYIEFHGTKNTDKDYRMYMTASNVPTETWILDNADDDANNNMIVFPNGLKILWDTANVRTDSYSSSATFTYRGTTIVDLTSYGFTSILCAFANVKESAGYWNATISVQSATSITVSVGGNSDTTKAVNWIVFAV